LLSSEQRRPGEASRWPTAPHKWRVRLDIRKRFFTRGQWSWHWLCRAVGRAPSCRSSKRVCTMLSDVGFGF